MSFLDSFTEEQRETLLSAATRRTLQTGEFLMRRGEPGGDLFFLEHGTLEVLDRQTIPEMIVAALGPGAVVGEMSFINEAPRSADVRCNGQTQVFQWLSDDLKVLLDDHPELASSFYRAVASLASDRLRSNIEERSSSTATSSAGMGSASSEFMEAIENIVETAKEGLLRAETRLRANGDDSRGATLLRETLDGLESDITRIYARVNHDDLAKQGTSVLLKELKPWLIRSQLADLCLRRPNDMIPGPEVLAHVHADVAKGEGAFGEQLDRWILYRPTLMAIRGLVAPTQKLVCAVTPRRKGRKVLLVHAGAGSLAAGLREGLARGDTELTILDHDRAALALVSQMGSIDGAMTVTSLSYPLGALATGRDMPELAEQDVIVVHGFFEYLPDRLAVLFLRHLGDLLTDRGMFVASALGPSADQVLLDRLLRWPTIRRQREAIENLTRLAGFTVVPASGIHKPGILFRATRG